MRQPSALRNGEPSCSVATAAQPARILFHVGTAIRWVPSGGTASSGTVEEMLHEFLLTQLEHEVVLTVSLVAGLITPAASAAPCGPRWILSPAGCSQIARMHHFALAAGTMPERRFRDVLNAGW